MNMPNQCVYEKGLCCNYINEMIPLSCRDDDLKHSATNHKIVKVWILCRETLSTLATLKLAEGTLRKSESALFTVYNTHNKMFYV